MVDYKFTLAEPNDFSKILSLYRSLIGTPGCTWNEYYPSMDTIEEDVNSNSLYTLKDVSGKIIAVASAGKFDELTDLQWSMSNPCELARIGVLSEYQNQGIGRFMLQNVLLAVKERGFDGVRMLVSKNNSAALALYEKNGFIRCGEAFMYEIDFYCYELRL